VTDFPDLKLKTLVSFPATAIGGTGLNIVKAGSNFTINLDYTEFPLLALPPQPSPLRISRLN
jgi:hypothetical protein